MSSDKLLRGKLTPVTCTPEELVQQLGIEVPPEYSTALEYLLEETDQYVMLSGKLYKQEIDETDDIYHCNAKINEDGSIDFSLVYYNCCDWAEILSDKLRKLT